MARNRLLVALVTGIIIGIALGYCLVLDRLSLVESEVTELRAQVAGVSKPSMRLVAVSFSRTEDTRGLLSSLISSANRTLRVMVMAITSDALAEALIRAKIRGVDVAVIIDDEYKTGSGSDYSRLLEAGIDIRSDNSRRLMHHKVIVVDGHITATGSYNWSAAAEESNWENVIVMDSDVIASMYVEEFNRIWEQTKPGE